MNSNYILENDSHKVNKYVKKTICSLHSYNAKAHQFELE